MKLLIASILLIITVPFYSFSQQKNDGKNLISVDFIPIIPVAQNYPYSGLLYKRFLNNHLALRVGLNGQFGSNNFLIKDTLYSKSTTFVITPRIGLEYIKPISDQMLFYFGSDLFLTDTYQATTKSKTQYFDYGILPFIGFSFIISKRFFISLETRCVVDIVSEKNPSNPDFYNKNLNITFFKDYSVFLGYRF